MAASDATVPPARAGLGLRIAAAAVLAPPTIAAIWLGGTVWTVAVAVLAAIALWEWARLVGRGSVLAPGIPSIAAAASIPVLFWIGPQASLAVAALCSLSAALTGAIRGQSGNGLLTGSGALYIALAGLALVWLRAPEQAGLAGVLWLVFAVWGADAGAYLFGRLIGGPRLAPRFSPNKTWAGLGGAMVGAILVGAVAATVWTEAPSWGRLAVAGAVIGIVGQAGDLLESAFKRLYGVKDSSNLIPGHGGVLDRIDALMAVALVAAIVFMFGGAGLAWSS